MPSFPYIIIYEALTKPVSIDEQDFLGVPEDHSIPIVRIRYPLEPVSTVDWHTSTEDFLGLPEVYNPWVVLPRYINGPESIADFFEVSQDADGTAHGTVSSVPIVRRLRYQRPSEIIFHDVTIDAEDFLGIPEDYSIPIVRSRFLFADTFQMELFPVEAVAPEGFRREIHAETNALVNETVGRTTRRPIRARTGRARNYYVGRRPDYRGHHP